MRRSLRILASLMVVIVFAVGGGTGKDGLVMPVSMYLADNTLYVSDPSTGIHVFDALPGTAPVHRAIVPFAGNTGTAARDDVVYANSWGGIFALRITATGAVDTLAGPFAAREPNLVWSEGPYDEGGWGCGGCATFSPQASPPASQGGGSSYAVFAIIDTFLYYVDIDQGSVIALSISRPELPRFLGETPVGGGLETLFPNGRYLFVGSQTGMHILDRYPDPVHPRYRAIFRHGRACDPVVVEDSLAYVTLRSGSACGETMDALLAVSIADPSLPRLLCSASPPTPYGVAVHGPYVYVGNGSQGLSLYESAPPDSISLLMRWPWDARDFIWSGSMLYVLEPANVSAYDVSDPRHPRRFTPGI